MQKGSCSGSFVRGQKWATASKKRVSVIYEGDSWLFVQLLSTTHTHTASHPPTSTQQESSPPLEYYRGYGALFYLSNSNLHPVLNYPHHPPSLRLH